MVGSNLESKSGLASVDLASIDYDKVDKNTKVVLIAGGSVRWKDSKISASETSIFELKESGFEKVQQQSQQNMGAPETLSSFLTYVHDNYKTDAYDLILWNHGGAVLGAEFDQLYNDDNLRLDEFKTALEQSPFSSNQKLELLLFRTCLNGTIETADAFKDYAKYMVASEEVTLGSANSSVLNFLNNVEISDSATEIGKKYIDSYKQQVSDIKEAYSYSGGEKSIYSTYSILDLSRINQLESNLNDFFADIDISKSYDEIAKVRSNLYQYAGSNEESYDMVDLYNLVDKTKSLSEQKAEALLSSINSTVVYNWATNDSSRGISIYLPFRGSYKAQSMLLGEYDKIDNLKPYREFLSKFTSTKTANTTSRRSSSYSGSTTFVNRKDTESELTTELTDDQVANFARADFLVFRDRGNGFYDPVYRGHQTSLDGNTLQATVKDRALKIYDKSNPSNQMFLCLFEDQNYDNDIINYTLGDIFHLDRKTGDESYDKGMDMAQISLSYDLTQNNIGIKNISVQDTISLGASSNDSSDSSSISLPSMVSLGLKDYETLRVYTTSGWKVFDDNDNYTDDYNSWEKEGIYHGIEIKDTDNVAFGLNDFNDGANYRYVFMIYDVDGNVYYSKPANMKGD